MMGKNIAKDNVDMIILLESLGVRLEILTGDGVMKILLVFMVIVIRVLNFEAIN